jgi:hypothetical protein
MMKFILCISLIVTSGLAHGQTKEWIKANIEAEVSRITASKKLRETSFGMPAVKTVVHFITYQYFTENKRYVKIYRQFSDKKDTVRQSFYLKNDQLIYANESIIRYYKNNNQTDSIGWSADFYFADGKLVDYISEGYGKPELATWNPQQDILLAFNEAIRDINKFKTKKMRG